MPLLIFLALFIGIPAAEIAVLIEVGGEIGAGATIALIIATAVIGTFVIRYQGLQVLGQAQEAMNSQQLPVDPVIHGVFLLLAGALLLTPGFLTDAIGFLCLVPPLRLGVARLIWSWMKNSSHVRTTSFSMSSTRRGGGGESRETRIIEGEFTEVHDEHEGKPDPDSPWAKPD